VCGIGGIVRIGDRKIRKWQLQQLAMELQHRGMDATGFALMDEDGMIHIWKVADPAWKAVAGKEFNNWCDKALTDRARILLVHTRQYTKGSPHNNENNHPLYSNPIEGVVIHNGMVRNDDGLFEANKKLHGFERSCATDSDIFRALLDNHGRIDKALIKDMNLVDGTAAVAAIHKKSPGKLLLLRDSNPLVLGATADTLAFASTKEALHKILKPWTTLHNIPMQVHAPDLSFLAMPDQTGWIIDVNVGLTEHDVFKANGRGVGGNVRYTKNTSYWDRQERARREATEESRKKATAHQNNANDPRLFEYTICPNAKCNAHVELSEYDRQLSSLALLACKACGTNLVGGQDATVN
jgi:asparagine synthetase B (glutamine-hydrolysing)